MTHLTDWQREMAAKIVAGNQLERPSRVSQIKPGAMQARGLLLMADNDEEDGGAARVSRAKAQASDAVALRLQQQFPNPWEV